VLSRLLTVSVAAILLTTAAGCGGSGSAEKRPTATPTANAETPSAPAGIDVAKINGARAAFVEACSRRASGGSGGTDDLRRSAGTLIPAFKANPDARFKRSPNAPEVTMRDTLRALGTLARKQCGGGAAVHLGTRLRRAAARGAGS
jgi:hypothetical protein